eukprot:m.898505 g.898505  ORF g.898505 m.898505 type:complete len:1335 (-) comp23674_c0_seq8:177-4181(-)
MTGTKDQAMAESTANSDGSDENNIKVFVRVRPLGGGSGEAEEVLRCLSVQSHNSIALAGKEERNFTFDGVKDEASTQEEVFGLVGRVVLNNCMRGYNGTIFAYGQTGSGKTYTMTGPMDENDNIIREKRGLMPRCFEHLFSMVSRETLKRGNSVKYLVTCSFLEIYNERIFDLLDATCTGKQLREDVKKGVMVRDLTELTITNANEACEVLKAGSSNRRVATTSMNRESSRSHAVFTVSIKSLETDGNMTNIRESRLHLIDLAGSERQRGTNAEGTRLKEAGSINKSLSALGNVITALVDVSNGKTRHIAYRDSKLTFLLRDSLGGNTKTFMIANISPASQSFGETLSTLQFAQRAKLIKNKATINENCAGNVVALQEEIQRLKALLAQGNVPAAPCGPVTIPSDAQPDVRGNTAELFMAALDARDTAEKEKTAMLDELRLTKELLSKKDKALQSTKMILKFRDAALAKSGGRAAKGPGTSAAGDEVARLQAELKVLQGMVDNHPDVTRFALQNLQLRDQLQQLTQAYPDAATDHQLLVKARAYTHLLERQLAAQRTHAAVPHSPKAPTGGNCPPQAAPSTPRGGIACTPRGKILLAGEGMSIDSPRAKRNANIELEKFKLQKELEGKLAVLTEQYTREKAVTDSLVAAAQQREAELMAELKGATRSIADFENTIRILQMRHDVEITKLQNDHSEFVKKFGKASSGLEVVNAELATARAELATLRTARAEDLMAGSKRQQELLSLQEKVHTCTERAKTAEARVTEIQETSAAALQAKSDEITAATAARVAAEAALEEAKLAATTSTEEYEKSISDLMEQLESADGEKESLEAELMDATTQRTQLEQELETERTLRGNFEDEIATLNAEMEFKELEFARITSQMTVHKQRISALETELKEHLHNSSEGHDNEREVLTRATARLEEELREARDAARAAETTATDGQAKLTAVQATLSAHVEENRRLREQLIGVTETAESNERELEDVKDAVERLTEQTHSDGQTIAELTAAVASGKHELEEEHQAHQEEVARIMQELHTVDRARGDAVAELERAETTHAAFQRDTEARLESATENTAALAALQSTHTATLQEMDALKQALEDTRAQIKYDNASAESQQQELHCLQKQLQDASALLDRSEDFKKEKLDEISSLKALLADKDATAEDLVSLRAELTDVEHKRQEESIIYETSLKEFQIKCERQQKEHNAMIEMYKKMKDEDQLQLQALKSEKDSIQARMARCEVNLDAALEDAEALVDELQRSREVEQALDKQKEDLKSKFEQSQEAKLRLEEDLATTRHQLQEIQKENRKMLGTDNNGGAPKMFKTPLRRAVLAEQN